MDPVGLTYFTDFVSKAGTPKVTVVKQFLKGDYDPRTDFWKALREGIMEFHDSHGGDKKFLDRLKKVNDQKKALSYSQAVDGYKKFLGKKDVQFFAVKAKVIEVAGLLLRVNPELGLLIDGQKHFIKLHLKTDDLPKNRIQIIQSLMKSALADKQSYYSVLDVKKGKLVDCHHDAVDDALQILVKGEASSFKMISDELQSS